MTKLPPPRVRELLAAILDQDGKRVLVTRSTDGKTRTQKLSENFKSNPVSLTIHDLNTIYHDDGPSIRRNLRKLRARLRKHRSR